MPARTTRSGREVKNSSTAQSKLDALELLARQRRGEKVDVGIKEEEPLFEDVVEEEYKSTRKAGFIVDRDSDEEEGDSDLDFIDDEGDFDDLEESAGGKRGAKSKRSQKKAATELDPAQRSMKSFLGGSSKSSASKPKPGFSTPSTSKSKPPVDQDEILSQMLYDVPMNRSSSIQRTPKTPMTRLSVTPKTLKTKANYEPSSVKRPRLNPTARGVSDFIEDAQQDTAQQQVTPSCTTDDVGLNDWSDSESSMAQSKLQELAASSTSNHHQDKGTSALANYEPDFGCAGFDTDSDVSNMGDDPIAAMPLNEDVKSNLEFFDTTDGKKYTRLYWYDCCEDQTRSPGVVYLFGKVYAITTKRYISCCAIVKNIQRTCYLLIKENCTYEEVVQEFSNIVAKRFKIKSFSCSKVTKKYAFSSDTNIPLVGDYVKLDYPATCNPLPSDLTGATFHVTLNTNQSPLEKTILDLKLRGPCWMRLIEPVASTSQLTWTKIEVVLESPEHLVVEENSADLPVPYFTAFSMSLRTYNNPTTHQNEIVAIAFMINTNFNLDQCLKKENKADRHFCLMAKPSPGHKELKLPYDFHLVAKKHTKTILVVLDSERDLLQHFMELKFGEFDPDIVIGHDLLNFDYETLVARMKVLKVGQWSKLGRFKRTDLPNTKAAFRYLFSGRVLCDIRTSAMELIRARSYDLSELCRQVLDRKRFEFNHAEVVESFKCSENLLKMLHFTWEDADSIFGILVELNIIPLALKITNITGNILSRTLAAGRSERNEYLLLHAFHEENFICPEKRLSKFQFNKGRKFGATANDLDTTVDGGGGDKGGPLRKKAAYAGGLVLEPKAGYYDSCVLLMDFNSLYPSIIQEFNICFSTIRAPKVEPGNEDVQLIAEPPEDSVATGVLPQQLRNLVDRRRKVKKLMADSKSPEQKLILDIEQKALKLTANSMYGCLGFDQSRFYAKHLASLVTFKGREILMSTKALVEKLGYEVIYGDTDSLMINTRVLDYEEVIQRGTVIKGEINRTFKLLEIDIDGVYRPLLLLKKKNYAGALIKKLPDGQFQSELETKGLDTVRRDRAVVAKEAGERVLSMVLAGTKDIDLVVEEVHAYLKELGARVLAGELSAEKFLISKQLNRNPEEYKDTKGMGHVALALRHNADRTKTKKLRARSTVDYVVCLDGTSESANQRAYTLEELSKSEGRLKLDYEYYLCQQIHPVMARICDKLPVTNAYVLAEMLGVERSQQLSIKQDDSETAKRDRLVSRGEARYHSCKPLVIKCPNCQLPDEISARTRKNKSSNKWEYSVSSCPQCGFRYAMRPRLIVVQIIELIRRLTCELFGSRFVCENPDCDYQTRNLFASQLRPTDAADFEGGGQPSGSADFGGRAQTVCAHCASPMLPEMDDRKMDLQLSFVKHLFDTRRSGDTGGAHQQQQQAVADPPEDLVALYESCSSELDSALRNSCTNNIDAHFTFSMICSGAAATC